MVPQNLLKEFRVNSAIERLFWGNFFLNSDIKVLFDGK